MTWQPKPKGVPKTVSVDPLKSQFRSPTEYAVLAADIFSAISKRNPRPEDWAVLSRIFGHIAVRNLQKRYVIPELIDANLKWAAILGDETMRIGIAISKNLTAAPITAETTPFERDVEATVATTPPPKKGNGTS